MDNRKTNKRVSNTNQKNRNKKTVTIGSLLEEGGNQKSTKGKGSMVKASSPELPCSRERVQKNLPWVG